MNPYQDQALQYLESGLGYPIPSVDPFAKFPPLVGYTGKRGATPSRHQVELWMDVYPDSNILLRLAKHIIGIDVDDYDDKHGARTMFAASREHDALPDTPFTSARGPGYSGIRYFMLDSRMDERNLKGDLGPDSHVEIIRHSHRYAVVPPSWHQGAEQTYKWYTHSGDIPHVTDIPHLPSAWYEHLTQKCSCFYEARKAQREQLSRYRQRPDNAQGTMLAQMDFEKNLETLSHLALGSRNNYLSRVAGRTFLFDCLMNEVLDMEEVSTQLVEAGIEAGLDNNEISATLNSAMQWAFQMNEEQDR